jgi:tetratricopeptide (TPR) repeat protein
MRRGPLGRMLCALMALAGCKVRSTAPPSTAVDAPEKAVQVLIDQGRADEALAQLNGLAAGPQTWLLQGRAWVKKAETAPLPTPPPDAIPQAGERVLAPEFKPEELKALEAFEKVAAASPQTAEAHLAIADLLAPHALRRHEAEQQQQQARKRGRPAVPAVALPAPAPGQPDWSADRILHAYRQAAQVRESSKDALDPWLRFALGMGRPQEAEGVFRELIKRDHESADPLARYGDFLVEVRKEPLLAVERYQQALIWRPDDPAIKAKLADIFLDLGLVHLKQREYMNAQMRFDEARKYLPGPQSPQAQRLNGYQDQLREVRSR